MIRRRFADLPERQVHYREAGEGPPLLMLHASPGSSKQLEGKIGALSARRRVIAPDTPGNGDSTPLPIEAPRIADYAAALLLFLDAVGIERCDVYGSHTGANIGLELAVLAPDRVRKVVLDGIGIHSDTQREIYLARYAPPIQPDMIGSQFTKAFMFCRDQYLFWPWFETAAANRREGGLPSPEVLHDWTLEVCKSITTYHLGYRAAFANRSEANLARVTQSVLFLVAQNDPLLAGTQEAAKLARDSTLTLLGHSASPDFIQTLARAVETFLDAV
jgi:pimeloyl-ACP methyl ester carboxylesterase